MSKPQKILTVPIETFWRELVKAGMSPREAKLQARVASIFGSTLSVDGQRFRIAKEAKQC